jgi:hypothetical protein
MYTLGKLPHFHSILRLLKTPKGPLFGGRHHLSALTSSLRSVHVLHGHFRILEMSFRHDRLLRWDKLCATESQSTLPEKRFGSEKIQTCSRQLQWYTAYGNIAASANVVAAAVRLAFLTGPSWDVGAFEMQ